MLTEPQKKYLITIYLLGQNGERVRTTDIADYLHVAKASAVKMCKKLIAEELIIKEPYRQITLTQKGVSEANGLFTPCVIIQEHLVSKIGLTAEKAGEISMLIASCADEETVEQIVSYALSQK
ncbi:MULTISPECIES: metal-dependent transcriptional regulator [Ruminococcus]|uniref:Iron dependent repressor n=1 Tax=Ruminococcus albus (strain ATCC 27210 / DSM 20455 / JCM 14654 / NCDO 2250 / 7) TaxID=697329 RepID=E6UER5_RUMA7|nr:MULTISPECIES: metal-dependent transcriptional regulator [Ruminococcus]ADU21834.1 iron dependent repressor [Ruminococcus albus 7 = DSM 20455]MCR5021439.1 metal-dependent transcriptional regulator [Ruminococcus sp.]